MLQVPFELMLEQLQFMPGRNGLAALFKALQQVEVVTLDDKMGQVGAATGIPVCMLMTLTDDEVVANPVQLDCWVVIPLPTEDQWKDATTSDPDLQLIV